ncbi:MAG: ABC transporter permease [Bacteroidales bacterium]|nr:ABC transporter permease [Bacteroidales bacterium]
MLRIAIKDIIIFFRDYKGMLLSFLLPIALITLFSLAFGGLGKKDKKQQAVNIFIADLDSTEFSENVIHKLENLEEINISSVNFEAGKLEIMNGNKLAMLVFYKGFADSVNEGNKEPIELFYDESREMEAGLLQYALISNLMEILGSRNIKKKIIKSVNTRYPDIDPSIMATIEEEIGLQFEDPDNGTSGGNIMDEMGGLQITSLSRKESVNWGLIQSFAGTAVMMLLFSVAAMGSSILGEREDGTLKRLLYSPVIPLSIMFGKMIVAIVIGTLQLMVMLFYSMLVLGLDLGDNLFYLFLVIVATSFACSGFGVFIAAISTTRKQAEGFSTIVILIMSAIGGSMIPIFIMPAFMQKVAVVSLNYWAIQGFYDVLGRDAQFSSLILKVGVLFLIGIIMSTASSMLFKRNILKVA